MATKQITRNIALTPHFDALVKRKVATGRYRSASEVVSDALRLLEERDRDRHPDAKAIEEEVELGLSQLDSGDVHDGAAVFEEIRALSRGAARKIQGPKMISEQVELSSAARLDLLQLWIYLADEVSNELADQVLLDIELALNQLAIKPGLGHRRQDLSKANVLFYNVHLFFIIYRPKKKAFPLQISRIIHAARTIKRTLRKGS